MERPQHCSSNLLLLTVDFGPPERYGRGREWYTDNCVPLGRTALLRGTEERRICGRIRVRYRSKTDGKARPWQ
jgi:hypothetical protein